MNYFSSRHVNVQKPSAIQKNKVQKPLRMVICKFFFYFSELFCFKEKVTQQIYIMYHSWGKKKIQFDIMFWTDISAAT